MISIKTKSVCPECKKVIDAELYDENGIIYMRKTCPEHGKFVERLWEANQFDRELKYLDLLHEYIPSRDIPKCPYDCETCNLHESPTVLGIIDVTNRCNLRCSYCFANAAVAGWLYEPKMETLKKQIDYLASRSPPPLAVLFSGGEPTMRNDLPELVKYASDKGLYVIIASNGYRIAYSKEYVKRLAEAGLPIIYLSFDGLTDETNTEKKNHLMIDKILNNCREAGLGIVLVPTIIKGLNDSQVWPIVKFATEHMDVIRGVNFQPISFSGRMSKKLREQQRYTISDLRKDIEKQGNGIVKIKDWYPIPSALPMSKLFESITGNRAITFSSHPMCGSATYLFKNEKDKLIPFPEFVDMDKFIEILGKYGDELRKSSKLAKPIKIAKMIKELYSTIDKEKKPHNFKLFDLLKDIILHPNDKNAVINFHLHTLFIGTMHFQDLYNVDLERLKYCTIHYITPQLTRVPFCAYNGDLGYREEIEKRNKKDMLKEGVKLDKNTDINKFGNI